MVRGWTGTSHAIPGGRVRRERTEDRYGRAESTGSRGEGEAVCYASTHSPHQTCPVQEGIQAGEEGSCKTPEDVQEEAEEVRAYSECKGCGTSQCRSYVAGEV